MRIAVLTNEYPPASRGGAGRIAALTVQALEARGHDVHVWHSAWAGHGMSGIQRLFLHVRDLVPLRKIVQEICAWHPDVLLTHNLTGCGWGTPEQCQREGIPWVHVLHDVQAFEPSGQICAGESWVWARRIWRLVWAYARRRSMGSPDAVIAPTSWIAAQYRAYGFFEHVAQHIIPNPVDGTIMSEKRSDAQRQAILFVGRVDYDKGIDVLLEAWREMPAPRPELWVAGDGAWRHTVEREGGQGCVVFGQLTPERVAELMREARVVVLPSRVHENQPTVIVEGLAAGCAVIASDVGGVSETMAGCGVLVPAGNVVELRQALEAEYNALTPRVYADARERCLQDHESSRVVQRVEDVLADVARSKTKTRTALF